MAIYLKDKKITPYRGDYKPVNIYQGAQKIAGWHDVARTGDSALEWDDTYNDRVAGYVHGQSELQAEYYASEGDSEQVQTVQGKNLFDAYKMAQTVDSGWETAGSFRQVTTGVGKIKAKAWATVLFDNAWVIKNLKPSTSYFFKFTVKKVVSQNGDYSTNYSMNKGFILHSGVDGYAAMYAYTKVSLQNVGDTRTVSVNFTTPSSLHEPSANYRILAYSERWLNSSSQPDYVVCEFSDIIISETDVPYEPFTPDSPSPDYPSPINPHLTAGTYKITMPDGTYEVTIPADMHGVGGVRDRVVVDYVSKKGWLDGRCAKHIFTGGIDEMWTLGNVNPDSDIRRFYCTNKMLLPLVSINLPVLCSHFLHKVEHYAALSEKVVYGYLNNHLYFYIDKSRLTADDVPSFKSWLAANTPEVVYQLAEPTQTPLTLTPVDSSTAPELPREFLADATEVSPELPATITSAQPEVVSRGRNLFDGAFINNAAINGTSGQLISLVGGRTTNLIPVKPSTVYTMSGGNRGGVRFEDAVHTQISHIATSGSTGARTFTTPPNCAYLQLYYSLNAENPLLQLEPGTTAHTYTPYRAPTTLEFPELRAIQLPAAATEWTYTDADGVKYWADTVRYVGGGWWDVVRRNFKIRWDAIASRMAHINSNETTTMIIMFEANKFGTYGSPKCFGEFESSYCSHFIYNGSAALASSTTESYACVWYSNPPYIMVRINNERIGALLTDDLPTRYNKFVAWEAEQAALGKPLTFGICIKEEFATTERIHLGTLASFPRYTHVEQIDNGLPIRMELDSRVIDRKEI